MASTIKQRSADTIKEDLTNDKGGPETPWVTSSLYYLFVFIFIGIPMWFYTCSKIRYSLPDLTNLERSIFNSPLRLHLEISVIQLSRFDAFKIDDDFSSYADEQTNYLRSNLPNYLDTSIENVTYDINWRVRRPTQDEFKIFQTHQQKNSSLNSNTISGGLIDLEQELTKIHRSSNRFRLFIYWVEEKHYPLYCDSSRVHSYTVSSERFVYLCPSSALSSRNNYASVVSLLKTILEEIYYSTVDIQKAKHILGNQIDLLFSLVPETYEDLKQLSPLAHKIHHIFTKNVGEQFPDLKELVNIYPITQHLIDLLSDELLDRLLEKSVKKIETYGTETSKLRYLKIDRIIHLFRDFEMRTNKHSRQNVHNVLVISPNSEKPPMTFVNTKSSNSVSILEGHETNTMFLANDDKSIVLGIRAIIRRVVGLTSADLCKSCLVRRDIFFTRWELDTLMGAFTLSKLKSTYTSLQSISQQLIGVRIPKDVAAMAKEAHQAASQSVDYLKTKRLQEAYRLSSKAYEMAESTYYNPSLLESSYFPEDLKYAIYTPLFVPLAISFATSMKELFGFFRRQLREH